MDEMADKPASYRAKHKLREAHQHLEQLPASREVSLAITNLEQAQMWLQAHIESLTRMGLVPTDAA